jgi:hypothetical protein
MSVLIINLRLLVELSCLWAKGYVGKASFVKNLFIMAVA